MPSPTQPLPDLLAHHARICPGKSAFSTNHRSITFAALAISTHRLASHLVHYAGASRVAIVLPRCIEFLEIILAITRASSVGVPLDPRASVAELRWLLQDSRACVVFTDRQGFERVQAAAKEVDSLLIVLVDATQGDIITKGNVVRYEEWTQDEHPHNSSVPARGLDDLSLDEPAWLHYTSGTTGEPKGVLSSQRAWLVSAANYAAAVGITAADKVFWPLPLYHAFGHSLCIIGTLVVGASVYLSGQGESLLISILRCEGVTVIAGVPSTYLELATELAQWKGKRNKARLPRPRLCITAGGTAPVGSKSHVQDMFGVPLLNNYGSTEACGPIATDGPSNIDRMFGTPLLKRYGCTESCGAILTHTPSDVHLEYSCGAPLPHLEVKITKIDTNIDVGESAATGEEGEIWIRGPSMMLQYWSSHTQRETPFTSTGWYRTGDLGRQLLGSGGHLLVTGRLNELIRRGSETIHPAELEGVIRLYPGVEDVVVTGVPHSMLGETVAAFVVRTAQDAEFDLVSLLAACRMKLPDHKVPTLFYEIDALPRTKAGKLRRRAALDCKTRPLNARSYLKPDMILPLVLAEVRSARGLGMEEQLEARLPFVDLGMNSLAGVVLRDRLASLTGLDNLPTTLVFDQPTPLAVSKYLCSKVFNKTANPDRDTPATQQLAASPPSSVRTHEPIAIISMDCRYPGPISSPADLWNTVISGNDVTSYLPTDRGWDLDALTYSDSKSSKQGTSATRRGGFLADMANFDATPFNMSPREALATDPQQRILLETTWHLIERARIAPSKLRGSNTGVFVGVMYSDYAGRFLSSESQELDSHLGLGSAGSVAAGRISYTFDFHGPSIAIDTACSSSLVAVDAAASSLRSGECTLAVAGGVTIMATPRPFIMFSRQGGLAPDGRCKSYSAKADGTAWSEGVGLLLLERLSDAQRNGHDVVGLIRGSAVNSDGASNGLTAPSSAAQERVMRQALENAGLVPNEVDVLEGHGTATPLGDAIEAQAVAGVYGSTEREFPLLLGSIKSNIGHSQAAAGVAGMIKMLQAMKQGVVPRSLHVDMPSPHIAKQGQIRLATEQGLWPYRQKGGPRRAAVSSFGIGGTNSHIILEEYVGDTSGFAPNGHQSCDKAAQGQYPWLLSGADKASVSAQAEALLVHPFPQQNDATDVAFSLATTRSALPHRAAVLLRGDIKDHASVLAALAHSQQHPEVVTGVISGSTKRLVFVFSGQASLKRHSIKGIKDLCAYFPTFDTAFRTICNELDHRLTEPLSKVIFEDLKNSVERTDLSQAIIFALQVAMYRLLESFGVQPDAVAGHSVGEIAAAHAGGYLSLPAAAALITTRARLMTALPQGQGAMASISASETDVREALTDLTGDTGKCGLAAVNGRNSVVVSGPVDAVKSIMGVFARQGRVVTLLKGVNQAFHSPLMDPILEELSRDLHNDSAFRCLKSESAKIPLVSTITGEVADASKLASPEYWTFHVRATVRFADAVDTLISKGPSVFLEIGPSAPLSAHVPGAIATRGTVSTLLEVLGRLWVHGIQIDWNAIFEGSGACVVDLPVYQFQRRRYWLEPPKRSMDVQNAHCAHSFGMATGHPIITDAAPVPDAPGNVVCHGYLSLDTLPWIADHIIGGELVVPATVLADLALSAGRQCSMTAPILKELAITKPLIFTTGAGMVIQVVVNDAQAGNDSDVDEFRTIHLYSRPKNAGVSSEWTQNATGALKESPGILPDEVNTRIGPWQTMNIDIAGAYATLSRAGIIYGPMFQCVRAVSRSEDGMSLRAQIQLLEQAPKSKISVPFAVHPALLDAALHFGALVMSVKAQATGVKIRLPFLLRGVQIIRTVSTDEPIFVQTLDHNHLGDDGKFSLVLEDQAGNVVARIAEVVTRPWQPTARAAGLYKLEWTSLTTNDIASNASRDRTQNTVDIIVQVQDFVTQHPSTTIPDAVRIATAHVLNTIQQWTLNEAFASGGRLVIVTENASAADPNLVSAAIWGLVRSAQAEFSCNRLVLIDLDGTEASTMALSRALASGQDLVAIRCGKLVAPKLSRVQTMSAPARQVASPSLVNTSGTVLMTGGTGALGAVFARHLVRKYNAKNLLLLSRLGPEAPGAEALITELTLAGAKASVSHCDVADRGQVSAIFTRAHPPVTAIFHAAGVLEDGILSTQNADRIARVLQPKVDGAWLLHEFAPLEAQVFLFSSAAGVLGNRGQAGYAAGNCFLDGLASYRRARGLHGLSLAWGPWENDSGMAGGRIRDGKLVPVSDEQGLDAFDAALHMCAAEAFIIPLLLGGNSVENLSLSREKQTLFLSRSLGGADRHTSWRGNYSVGQSREDRIATLRGLLHDEVAQVLGYQPGEALPDRPFSDLGMDSFTAIQLRNRVSVLSGLKGLPATLAFDAKTLTELVENLVDRLDKRAGMEASNSMSSRHNSINMVDVGKSDRTDSRTGHDPNQPAPIPASPKKEALHGLASLCHRMCQAGQYNAAAHILAAASLTLSRFTTSPSLPVRPTPLHLATGSVVKPALLFIPDFTPTTSEGESRYTFLAAALGSDYDIHELPHPTVLVPDSLEVLAEVHADTVLEIFAGRAVILVGFSAGGCVAHAVANRLLSQTTHEKYVVGLILIDAYNVAQDNNPEWLMRLALPAAAMLERDEYEPERDNHLAVVGSYFKIIAGWSPDPLPRDLPTLFVRATEPMPGVGQGWRPAEWPQADKTVEVAGHHLSILADGRVSLVEKAIRAWIDAVERGYEHQIPRNLPAYVHR